MTQLTTKQIAKSAVAFLLVPAAAPIFFRCYLQFFKHTFPSVAAVATSFVAISSYTAILVFGLPTYLAMRSLGLRSLRVYLCWGLGLGIVGDLISVWLFGPSLGEWLSGEVYGILKEPLSTLPELIEIWSLGVLGGFLFWLITRPDLVTESEVT